MLNVLGLLWKFRVPVLILALLLGNAVNYKVGYWKGYGAGKTFEKNQKIEAALKATKLAASEREKIEDETRRLTDPDVDRELHDNGWMRQNL